MSSTPSFFDFNPKLVPYQYRVIHDIKESFDYSTGPHFCLLSGSIGSAKSVLMAWLIIKHCTEFDGARVLLGRKALPDLKDTIFTKILEMLDGSFTDGKDFKYRNENGYIKFRNGSEIISRSWADKKFKKFRSLEVSMIAIEELTENDARYWPFFVECIGRLGRLPHVPENIFIAATNPDDPSHPAHKFFIKGATWANKKKTVKRKGNIHTYFSRTEDNPFLPSWYIESLKQKYDKKMIQRLLYGQWLYISTDVIYYNYDPDKHFVLENTKPDPQLDLRLSFDFNISKGKPMSSAAFVYNPAASNKHPKDRSFTFIDEVAVEGARTLDALEEWTAKGFFDLAHNPKIIVHGDATGSRGDTRGKASDYDIIEKYLANYVRKDGKALEYELDVGRENPPIRERHNIANGQLENANGVIAVAIDKRCENIDKGFSNTRLKEGARATEDQTTEGQDMSTAVTYGIHRVIEYGIEEFEDVEFY